MFMNETHFLFVFSDLKCGKIDPRKLGINVDLAVDPIFKGDVTGPAARTYQIAQIYVWMSLAWIVASLWMLCKGFLIGVKVRSEGSKEDTTFNPTSILSL